MKKRAEKYSRNYDRIENVLLIAILFSTIISFLQIKQSYILLPTFFGVYAIANHFAILWMHKRIDIDKEISHSVVFWYRIYGIGYTLLLLVFIYSLTDFIYSYMRVLLAVAGVPILLGLGFLYPRKKDMQQMGFSYYRAFIKTLFIILIGLLYYIG